VKIRVLGCSGAEFPGHHPAGFLLDDKILFDAGSVTNVLGEKEQARIRHIFVTHAHLDHVRGIPFLADNIIIGNWRHQVSVFGIAPVLSTIKRHLLNSSIWPDLTVIPNPGAAALKLTALRLGRPTRVADYVVTPYAMNHSVPAVGYLVEDGKQRRFFYTGDTGPFDSWWEEIGQKQIHCLITEVSFPNRMRKMAITSGHMTAGLLKQQLAKIDVQPERVYITHPKPQYLETIKKELDALEMDNLSLLSDGEVITI
jgi:ribonuclease BN (tRNA processing enzyme)